MQVAEPSSLENSRQSRIRTDSSTSRPAVGAASNSAHGQHISVARHDNHGLIHQLPHDGRRPPGLAFEPGRVRRGTSLPDEPDWDSAPQGKIQHGIVEVLPQGHSLRVPSKEHTTTTSVQVTVARSSSGTIMDLCDDMLRRGGAGDTGVQPRRSAGAAIVGCACGMR